MGVFIKGLVIHQISGGVVNFGNSIHSGSNETSKSIQVPEQVRSETAPEEAPQLKIRFLF